MVGGRGVCVVEGCEVGEEGWVDLYQAPHILIKTVLSQTHPNNCRDPKGKINA